MKKVILLIISSLLLFSCSTAKKDIYLAKPNVNIGYDYQLNFVKYFLKGQLCKSKYYFYKSNSIFASFDKIEEIGNNYYYLYSLYKYIGKKNRKFYDLALSYNKEVDKESKQDLTYKKYLKNKKLEKLYSLLKEEKNPLYVSVYSREAIKVSKYRQEKKKFLDLAFSIDKKYGWTLFLIEDWKISKKEFSSLEADSHLKILESSLETCDFVDGYL